MNKESPMINENDLNELKRMATNLYDSDKARINKILRGITELVNENVKLKIEVEKLKKT